MATEKTPLQIERERQRLTIGDLARKAGIVEVTIRRIESEIARKRPVDLDVAQRLATALNVPVSRLIPDKQLSRARPQQKGKRGGVICPLCRQEIPLIDGSRCSQCNPD
jgi:transcriptional regulator with XRE-family HTH domain